MRIRNLLLLAIMALVVSTLSFAQTGSITGTVTDTAGAVVAGAKVTVLNVATGAERSVTTSETGAYSVTPLPVGSYNVTVESKGFRKSKIANVTVTVAQVVPLNVTLSVGSVTETVEVKGEDVPQVDTESSSVSAMVDNKKIETLPMITRDPYSLVLLAPGTTQSNSSLGGFSVNGSRERNNNFTLDGTDNNDTSVPGIPGGASSLSPEATDQFRVITNNFMPEYGRNTGAIVDIVTKSGTNNYHGEGHWFGRYNSVGGARDYFNKKEDGKQDPYVRNIFGYSFGGPIKKDKTFFFFNNEFQRFRTALTTVSKVPTDSLKSGRVTLSDGTVVDFTNPNDPNNVTGMTGIDPSVKKVLDLYPTPNGASNANYGNYFFPTSSVYNYYGLTGKIDHRFTDKHQVSLRYILNNSSDPDPFHDDILPGIGAVASTSKSHNLTANFTSTLSNNLINDVRAGFNRIDAGFNCTGLDQLNILGVDSFGRGRDLTLPGITSFGCAELGDSDGQARRTGTYSFSDTLTWVKGAHTIKFGGEARFVYENGFNAFGSRETLSFNAFSGGDGPSIDPALTTNSTIQNLGWMLTGVVEDQSLSEFFNKSGNREPRDFRKFRQHEYAGYVQDSWKLRRNFTLNFGARYAFNGVPYEANGNLSNLFADPSSSAPFTFSLVGPGSGKLLYNNDFSMFEPRVGFAWDIFGDSKTSLRGGFGIFHDRVFGNLFGNASGNPPFQQTFTDYPLYYYGPSSALISTLPFAGEVTTSAVVEDGAMASPVLIDPNLKMPRSMNWNLGIQRQLNSTMSFELDYVGSQADRILRVMDGNPPNPEKIQEALAAGANPSTMTGAGLWYKTFAGVSLTGNSALYQPSLNRSIAKSNYNSLQSKLTTRMTHGITFDASYTWAHGGDNASDPLAAASGNRTFPRNSNNLNAEWGNSDFDMRHRIVVDYTVEMPFGKGTTRLADGFVGRALEGWSLAGMTSWQSGHPFDVFGYRDSQHQGLSDRAKLVGDPYAHATVNPANGPYWGPNVNAFTVPDWNTASNLGRNNFYGPHYFGFNMVVSKKMKFGERFNTELRIEGYNVFNHPNFGQPANAIADPETFGYLSTQIGNPDSTTGARQFQFGLKLNF